LIKKNFTPQAALQKAKHFCGYQERCHNEVKEKLYSFGLKKHDVEILLCQLIEEDYLNELRFAEQFAGGKFRMKQWGKIKIVYELKQKRISEYIIKKAI
jgi:regulatory protein